MLCEAMLLKTRAQMLLSISKKLKTLGLLTPSSRLPQTPHVPLLYLSPHPRAITHTMLILRAPAPQTLRAQIPTWRLPAGAPLLSPGGTPDLRSPIPTSTPRRARPADLPGGGAGVQTGRGLRWRTRLCEAGQVLPRDPAPRTRR